MQALKSKYGNLDLPPLDLYQDFSEYLDGIGENEGRRYLRKKDILAEQMLPHITKSGVEETLDLAEMSGRACSEISKWNGVSAIPVPTDSQ